MSSRSELGDLENLEDSLPSWTFEHLGEESSYMANKVNQLPSSPRENPPRVDPPEVSPQDDSLDHEDHGTVTHTPLENFPSIITQGNLDHLRMTYSFPARL